MSIDVAPLKLMVLVKVEVADVDVPTMVLSDVLAALFCHFMMCSMCGKLR